MAIGLPVVSILGLFGGISAESVVVAYVGTFSTVAFAVALTVLVSTLARRVRDAIMTSYLLLLFWLLVPPLILRLRARRSGPRLYFWIEPVNDWLVDLSPLGASDPDWCGMARRARPCRRSRINSCGWSGSSSAGPRCSCLLAIWRLRPIFRRQEETRPRRKWFRSAKAAAGGAAAMARPARSAATTRSLWKERYFAPVDRFTRFVLLPAIIVITLPLALMTEVEGGSAGILVDLPRNAASTARRSLRRRVPLGACRSTSAGTSASGCWPSPARPRRA